MNDWCTVGISDAPQAFDRPRAGRRIRTRAAAGFVFTEALYRPRARTPWHDHELAGLALVASGGYRRRIQRREVECGPGTVTLEPPGVGHAESYGAVASRVLLVEVLPWRAAGLAEHGLVFSDPLCGEDSGTGVLARRAVVELRQPDGASEVVLEGLGLELFAIAHRMATRTAHRIDTSPRWLHQVAERLRADFRSDISLSRLAASVGVHPAHLARTFRARELCSVGEFVRRRRIEWTAERLETTDDPIASIAAAVGFCDQSHFTRVFAHQMGLSPGRYRALARGRSSGT